MKTLKEWKQPDHQINRLQHLLVREILRSRGFDLRPYTGFLEMFHLLQPEQTVQQHFHNQVENQIHLMKSESSQILNVHKRMMNRLEQVQKTVQKHVYSPVDMRTINRRIDGLGSQHFNMYSSFYQGANQFYNRSSAQTLYGDFLNTLKMSKSAKSLWSDTELLNTWITHYDHWAQNLTQSQRLDFQKFIQKQHSIHSFRQFFKSSNARQFQRSLKRYITRHQLDSNVVNALYRTFDSQLRKEGSVRNINALFRNQQLSFNHWSNPFQWEDLSPIWNLSRDLFIQKTVVGEGFTKEVWNELFYDRNEIMGEHTHWMQQSVFKKQLLKRMYQTFRNNDMQQWHQKEWSQQHLWSRLQYLFKLMHHQHVSLRSYGFADAKKRVRKQRQFVEKVMHQVFLQSYKARTIEQQKQIKGVMKKLLKDQRFFSELLAFYQPFTERITDERQWQTKNVRRGDWWRNTFINNGRTVQMQYKMRDENLLDTHFYNQNLLQSMGDEIKRFNAMYQMTSQKELDRVVAHFIQNNQVLLNKELYERFKESNRIDTFTHQFLTHVHMDQVEQYNPFADFNYNTILNYVDLNRSYDVDKKDEIHRISRQTEERTQKEVEIYESIAKQKLLHQLKKTFEKNMVKYYRSQFLDHAAELRDRTQLLKTRMDFRTARITERLKEPLQSIWNPEINLDTPFHYQMHFEDATENLEMSIFKRNRMQRNLSNKHQQHMWQQFYKENMKKQGTRDSGWGIESGIQWIQNKWTYLYSMLNGNASGVNQAPAYLRYAMSTEDDPQNRKWKPDDTEQRRIDPMIFPVEEGYDTLETIEIYKMETVQNTETIEQVTTDLEKRFEKLTEEIQEIRNHTEKPLNMDKISDQIFRRLNQRMKVERQRRGVI